MKERPILFNAAMVKAILEGQKTQTRRVVEPQPDSTHDGEPYWNIGGYRAWAFRGVTDPLRMGTHNPLPCPYGQPGDRLYVRETWGFPAADHPRCKDGRKPMQGDRIVYLANDADAWQWRGGPGCANFVWRPSIHMPRWASRITLEITDVRVERLQDISETDARAEGIVDGGCLNCGESEPCGCVNPSPDARDAFVRLWQSIKGSDAWHDNPLVWVIEFKEVK